ncbi:MAG: hypothetical protein ACRCS9_06900, partial [Hyphomicrobium sp.]
GDLSAWRAYLEVVNADSKLKRLFIPKERHFVHVSDLIWRSCGEIITPGEDQERCRGLDRTSKRYRLFMANARELNAPNRASGSRLDGAYASIREVSTRVGGRLAAQ